MFTLNTHAVPLRDKDGEQRRTDKGGKLLALGVQVRAEKAGDRIIKMTASTEDVDRMGDIIRADGWGLEAYKKNPVILWGHDHTQPAIATAKKTWVDDNKLLQEWYFPVEYGKANPFSEMVYVGYEEGIFKASSVGFMPLVMKPITEGDDENEKVTGTEFTKQELYEVSAVNVPANREALQTLQAKGFDTVPITDTWQHLEGFVIDVKDDEETADEPIEEVEETKEETDQVEGDLTDTETTEDSPKGKTPITEIFGSDFWDWLDDNKIPDYPDDDGVDLEPFEDDKLIAELEARGYGVVEDIDVDFTDETLNDELELDLNPQPSQIEIDEAEVNAVAASVMKDKIKRAIRREYNKRVGILED